MRKTTWFKLWLLLLLLTMVGCINNPQKQAVLSSEPLTADSATEKSLLPFSLQLPTEWTQRCTVSRTLTDATVSIDGRESFTVTYTDNAPGAKALDLALVEDGYTYFAEDGAHFFYYKFHEEVPEELLEYVLSGKTTPKYWDKETRNSFNYAHIMLAIFQFLPTSEDCKAELQYSICPLEDSSIDCWLTAKEETYTNYRLGLSFAMPAKMQDECEIRSNGYDIGLFTADGENRYEMLFFAVCPQESKTAYYYEFMEPSGAQGDTLYFARSCWTTKIYVYKLTYNNSANEHEGIWAEYPLHIQNRYTFEEVQQIVDSFTILSDTPDSGD